MLAEPAGTAAPSVERFDHATTATSSAMGARTAKTERLKTNMVVLRMWRKPTGTVPSEKPDKSECIVWRCLTVQFMMPAHGPASGHAGVREGCRPRLVRPCRDHPRYVAGHGLELRGAARGTPRHPPAPPHHPQGLGIAP